MTRAEYYTQRQMIRERIDETDLLCEAAAETATSPDDPLYLAAEKESEEVWNQYLELTRKRLTEDWINQKERQNDNQ